MPDIREGLEVGGEAVIQREPDDVNTAQGFEAAVARAAGIETGNEDTSTEPSTDTAPATEPATEQTPPEPDEQPSEWQIRYDEAQKVIGRQGQELGELRRMVEEIQRDGGGEPAPLSEVTLQPGQLDEMVGEHGGDAAMEWAIQNAPHLIDDVLDAWYDADPRAARKFDRVYSRELNAPAPQVPQTPELDPTLGQVALERKLVNVWKETRTNNTDFSEWERGIQPALSDEATPDEIKAMLMSGNMDHMRAGVKFLIPYAKIHAAQIAPESAQSTAAKAAADAAEATRQETARRTSIVSGSQRASDPGEQPNDTEMTREQRHTEFKRRLLTAPNTDISSGLTVNGKSAREVPDFLTR